MEQKNLFEGFFLKLGSQLLLFYHNFPFLLVIYQVEHGKQ